MYERPSSRSTCAKFQALLTICCEAVLINWSPLGRQSQGANAVLLLLVDETNEIQDALWHLADEWNCANGPVGPEQRCVVQFVFGPYANLQCKPSIAMPFQGQVPIWFCTKGRSR